MLSKKRIGLPVCIALCLLAVVLTACSSTASKWQDGYYTAEAADFDDYGWKEYITICVINERIVSVEYNAKNASGLVKSWDMEYMRVMNAVDHTYPNEYTRVYSEALLSRQDPGRVDAIAGATHSHHTFQQLAQAAIEQAKVGDKNIAYVTFLPQE